MKSKFRNAVVMFFLIFLNERYDTYLLRVANNDGHNDAVDGHGFTEDDADQVFRPDAWRFYSTP